MQGPYICRWVTRFFGLAAGLYYDDRGPALQDGEVEYSNRVFVGNLHTKMSEYDVN